MKAPIIYTRHSGTIPGYEDVPYGDGCFWYDPKRRTHQDAQNLVNLYEDGEVDKVMKGCDFEPMPWWDQDLFKMVSDKATGMRLSEN